MSTGVYRYSGKLELIMKNSSLHKRVWNLLSSLPDVYSLQPTTNYYELVSNAGENLTLRAWARTAEQLSSAVRDFEQREPEIAERLREYYKLNEEQRLNSAKFAALTRRAEELQRASRLLDEQFRAAVIKHEDDVRSSEPGLSSSRRASGQLAEV